MRQIVELLHAFVLARGLDVARSSVAALVAPTGVGDDLAPAGDADAGVDPGLAGAIGPVEPGAWTALDLLAALERGVLERARPGQIFTPPQVARWLAAAAGAQEGGLCLDLAAGTGRLLLAALEARCAAGIEPARALGDLVGIEIDPLAAAVARAALCARAVELGAARLPTPRVAVGDGLAEGLAATIDGGLQGATSVVLNPPFGAADVLPSAFHDNAARWPFHKRQIDQALFFLAAGLDALGPSGRLAAIVPRYWLEATGAAAFRAWLCERASLTQILDLGNQQVWPEAEVLTALVVLKRRTPAPAPVWFWRECGASPAALWASPGQPPPDAYPVQVERLGAAPWTARPPAQEARIEALERASLRLEDWFQIGQGIKTGLNAAFVLTRAEADRLGLPPELLRPTIKARDIEALRLRRHDRVMLRALDDLDLDRWPALRAWLARHEDPLRRRYQARSGQCRWFALSLPQNLALMAQAPKIVSPLYARRSRFAVDRAGLHVATDVYVAAPRPNLPVPVEAVAALLNAAPARDFVQARAKLKRDGYMELGSRLLRAMPLPDPARTLPGPALAALALGAPAGVDPRDPWEGLAQAARWIESAADHADLDAHRAWIDRAATALYNPEAP